MNSPPEYPSVLERSFTIHSISFNPKIHYLRHPTGVLIMTLAPEHELMSKEISTVIWDIGNKKGRKQDRSKLEICGKGKKGGLQLLPETRICIVKDSNGDEHLIRAGLKATLLEVNDERLVENPNLMRMAAYNQGFIAILMSPLSGRGAEIPKEFTT